MIEVAHMLTSATKIRIFHLLEKPRSPDNIAELLNITRQGVDKHLKDLTRHGLVEKMWVLTAQRPRVEYKSTELGKYLFDSLENLMLDYRRRGKDEATSELKSLDRQLISGEIDSGQYLERKQRINEGMEWFIEDSN